MGDWVLVKVETGLMIKEARMQKLRTKFSIRIEMSMSVTMASLDNTQTEVAMKIRIRKPMRSLAQPAGVHLSGMLKYAK